MSEFWIVYKSSRKYYKILKVAFECIKFAFIFKGLLGQLVQSSFPVKQAKPGPPQLSGRSTIKTSFGTFCQFFSFSASF